MSKKLQGGSEVGKAGRPSGYREEHCEKLKEYFSTLSTKEFMGKKFPEIKTVEGFCSVIKISKQTFYNWLDQHSQFLDAWGEAKASQAEHLIFLSANRLIDPNYGKLLTVNCTDYKDKVESTVEQKTIQINIDSDDENL